MRWGLESNATDCVPVQLHVNDADADRRPLLEANLEKAALPAEAVSYTHLRAHETR